jgi:hypothetical protein
VASGQWGGEAPKELKHFLSLQIFSKVK